jgi:precorrin-4 methylase
VRRLVPEINRALMLVRRKNRSLTPAAEAIWQVARQQATLLHQRRQESAEY